MAIHGIAAKAATQKGTIQVKDELSKWLDLVRDDLRTARNVGEPAYVENEYVREALVALHSAVDGLADIVERLIEDQAGA